MLKGLAAYFTDFLFPKSEEIYLLEALSPGDILLRLEPAQELSHDTIALFNYADTQVRTLIWELKYRKNMKVARILAHIVEDVLTTELAERALTENFVRPLLVPIPQSASRRRERGFNQTEVLAQETLALGGGDLAYLPHVLSKEHHTQSQARTHSKRVRLENVQGSMHITDPSSVRGRNIILLDDVTTTGATFNEARRVLKEAGAKKILAIAVAH